MTSSLIVGCDPSSKKLSFYALHPVLPTVMGFTVALTRPQDKYTPKVANTTLEVCWDAIHKLEPMKINKQTPCYLFLEEPVMGRGGVRTTMVQSYVSGVVQACFTAVGFTVYLTNQSTWKAWLGVAGGRTKAGEAKPDVQRAMKMKFPKDHAAVGRDNDLLDAAALARYGSETVRRGVRLASPGGMSG